jgi:outer membrane biosynthesis protein TonB
MKTNYLAIITILTTSVFAATTDPIFQDIVDNDIERVVNYLEGGNSPDIKDAMGNPALVVATTYNQMQMVGLFLDNSANPNLTNAKGMTALMVAIEKKYYSIMRLLLQYKTDVNVQNPQTGETALMYAVKQNDIETVKLLLGYQANVNLKNKVKTTAIQMAQTLGHTTIFQLLLNQQLATAPTEELKPIVNQPKETKPVETKPIETKPVETKPVETKPIETKPVETKPIETKPVETKPIETKPVVTKPVTPKPAPLPPTVTAAPTLPANIAEYVNKVDYLVNQEHFELARKVLKDGYQATESLTILQKWLEIEERFFNPLKIKNKQRTLTQRPQIPKTWNLWSNRQRQIQYESQNPIATLPLNEVDKIMQQYEQLKTSLTEFSNLLQKRIREGTASELRTTEELLTKQKMIVDDIKQTRRNYLSFDVFSPYLARAEQQMFLSENYLGFSHSSTILKQAVQTLAQCAHNQLIYGVDDTVIEQFFKVYSIFKKAVGKTLDFQEIVIIHALADELQKQQFMDMERWWKW